MSHDESVRNALELALSHLGELIGMTHEIACDMHGGLNREDAILHISGRLATLMYCAARELKEAQQAVQRLSKAF